MSSENMSGYLNLLAEVQARKEAFTGEKSSSVEHNDIKEEMYYAGDFANDTRDEDFVVKAKNVKPEKVDTKPENEVKCDNCSTVDVENITNRLAEKVIIENTDSDTSFTLEEVKCDTGGIETNDEKVKAAVSPDKLINKVFKLNISEVGQQDAIQKESAVIVNHQTDSLKNLLEYESSSSDEVEEEENWQLQSGDKSDTETLDSDDLEDPPSGDDDDVEAVGQCGAIGWELKKAKKRHADSESPIAEDLKMYRSENNLHEYPPIRDVSKLDIDVGKEEFLHMGHIEAVIETLVTVESIPGMPAYDLDTCLFVDHKTAKTPLGAVYDVIGPVHSPLYCIRFRYPEDIAHLDLKKGVKVFCAPKTQFTRYVFVKELMSHKGTDASWVGDIEIPPEIAAELSDDEYQLVAHEPRKAHKRKHNSQERHRQFEESMNRCNELNTEAFRYIEAQQHVPRISRYNDQVQRVLFDDLVAQSTLPALFDPTVPPPGFPRAPSPCTTKWHVPATALPRCQFFGHNQSYYPSTYTNNGTNYGPGTSSHPH